MYREAGFFEREGEAVLMRRNYGFISAENADAAKDAARTARWAKLLGADEKQQLEIPDVKNPERIFLRDAERTFSDEKYRKRLINVLTYLQSQFHDYQQNISFIVSFMLLTCSDREVVSFIMKLHGEDRYLPGHWEQEAVGSKTDAFLFMKVLETRFPELSDVVKHMNDKGVPVDFLKKWFSGLGVHVFSLESLFQYFEAFFEEGFMFCLKFGVAFFRVFKDDLLKANDTEELLETFELNLRRKFDVEKLSMQIVQKAKTDEYPELKDFDLQAERKQVHKEKIEAPLLAAQKYAEENPIEEQEDCPLCDDGFLDLYCSSCKIKLCEDCHEAAPATLEDSKKMGDRKYHHLSTCPVAEVEDEDDEEEEDEVDQLADEVTKLKV